MEDGNNSNKKALYLHSTREYPGFFIEMKLLLALQLAPAEASKKQRCAKASCPQSLPASESFPMSQLFAWGGQRTGVSALASVLPMNTQDWSHLEWTSCISLQSKRLSRVFSNTTVQKHQFFGAQLSSQSNTHIHIWPLELPGPWLDEPLLAK